MCVFQDVRNCLNGFKTIYKCELWEYKILRNVQESDYVGCSCVCLFYRMWMFAVLFNNQCLVTLLPYSISVLSMWQRRVRPCRSHRACTHKPEVSSSSSSPCSIPTPPCSSPWAAAGTPRSWPPGCATASACSSSWPPSQQKCTSIPRSGRRLPREAGRGPSVSTKAGNNVVAAPLYTPVNTREVDSANLSNSKQDFNQQENQQQIPCSIVEGGETLFLYYSMILSVIFFFISTF